MKALKKSSALDILTNNVYRFSLFVKLMVREVEGSFLSNAKLRTCQKYTGS